MNADAYIEDLAESIAAHFVGHADKIPKEKWREQWVWINRAALLLTGAAVTLSAFGPLAGMAREIIAERILGAVRARISPRKKQTDTFLEGIEKRVLQGFLAVDGHPEEADRMTLRQLRSWSAEVLRQRRAS